MTIRITDIDGKKPSFVQWDVDRVLYIEGCDSQPCLHFANPLLTRAIVVEAEADGSRWVCTVPNIILQTAAPIVISVFVQPDEGKTVLTDWVKVQPKMKPQDYTYEENIGYTNWVVKSAEAQAILDAIEDLRQEIAEAAEAADDAAESAGEARDQAVAAADAIDESIATALQDAKESGEFDGRDGQDGAPGPKGDRGDDGISPDVSVEVITGGHRVTIVDADNTYVFDVMDGDDGDPGAKGDPGDDGFSPEVSVTTITGGHRVTITDAEGTNVFDVMDGEKGDPGESGGVTYYSAAVASDGTLTMPADMPTPTEIKASVGSGASLPLLRIYDWSWTNGSDQVLGHRNYYYELRYAERPALTPIFAKFNNVLKVPSSGELIFVEVEGVEENGSTTWTISKQDVQTEKPMEPLFFTAAVSSSGVLTMPADMPSPQTLATIFSAGTGESFPMIRLSDQGWFYNDTVNLNRIYLNLVYSQRHRSGSNYAMFEGSFENPDGSGPAHIWIKGIEENNVTTWTIGKEALGGGGGSSEEIFWATYNTTTYAEIKAADDAGKLVMLKAQVGYELPLTQITSNGAQFGVNKADAYYFATVTSANAWSVQTGNLVDWNEFYAATGDPNDLTTTATDLTGAANELNSGKLDKAQGVANAGKFLVVGSDGNITLVTMAAWQGGNY